MDTVTHIVLGACIGEALAGRRLGKKAMFIGAVANSLPDIDFVASFFLPTTSDLLAHRGFTHSFLFVALASPLLAWFSARLWKDSMPIARWTWFWGLQLLAHIVLDAFNAYGTGWFEPFSHYRVAFNTMFVADPLFTIWLIAAFIALLVLRQDSAKRRIWTKAGLICSTAYLLLGIVFKLYIDSTVKSDLSQKRIGYDDYFSTPTPLNNILWYVVAKTEDGYYTGYRSVFDRQKDVLLHFVPRKDSLLKYAVSASDVAYLKRFSQGYYTCEKVNDTAVFTILRFGEINGWNDSVPKFVCYYYLQYPDNNSMMIQRGRVARWDKQTLQAFFNRIKGR